MGTPVRLRVNRQDRRLELNPRVTLLDALRLRLGLTGAKTGCDRGPCGSCTVLVGGRRMLSCLSLAVQHRHHSLQYRRETGIIATGAGCMR